MAANETLSGFEKFCGGSPIWNQSLLSDGSWPQFTECFQLTILVWAPCAWLWLTLPLYLYNLLRKDDDSIPTPTSYLNLSKNFIALVLVILCVVDIIQLASNEEDNHKTVTNAAYVGKSIQAATFLLTVVLVQLERRRGFITSGVLFIFWFLSTVTCVIPFYSKIIQKEYDTNLFTFVLFYIQFGCVFIEFLLQFKAENVSSRHGYTRVGEYVNPEVYSSFPSRISFWWMNRLVLTGYKKALTDEDVAELHPRDKCSTIGPVYEKLWNREVRKCKKTVLSSSASYHNGLGAMSRSNKDQDANEKTPLLAYNSTQTVENSPPDEVKFAGKQSEKKVKTPSLLKVLVKTYGFQMFQAHLCKLVYDGLQFVSPMLLNILIGYVENKDNEAEWKGYIYAGSFFVVALLGTCFYHQNFQLSMVVGMRIKSVLISAVYKKALTMDNDTKKSSAVGEIVNLMSVDCERIANIAAYLWAMWSAPLQITIALVLLYGTLGPSIFAGLVTMIVIMPFNALLAMKQRKLQVQQMKLKDARLKLMNEVLNGIKALSMGSSLNLNTGDVVNLMAVDSERICIISQYIWAVWSAPFMVIVACIFLWVEMGPSVLSGIIILLILVPINFITMMMQRRYQNLQMKLKDKRIQLMNEVLCGIKVLKLYAWEPSFQKKVSDIRNEELRVLRKNAYLNAFSTFCWTCAPFLVTLATFTTYVLVTPDHYLDAKKAFVALSLFNILRFPINMLPMIISFLVQAHVSISRINKFLNNGDLNPENVQKNAKTDFAMSIEKGTFSWDRNLQPALKNINIEIPHNKLYAVVGQVGSGKSSLISAFLGELEKLNGDVCVNGSIAYVSQQAWIQNATLKDNIMFGKDMKKSKYEKVLEACALKPDLEILPGGDMTEIGEKGINLSGGQKQRVSLARAVYNDADIYLLDDPLSAVDSHVGKHIFSQVIGEKGMLRHKTRILVTHGVHWLPMVDTIVVMVDGKISEIGSYEELLSHDGDFAQFLKTYLTQDSDDSEEEEEDPENRSFEESSEVKDMRSKMLERVDSVTSDGVTSDDAESDISRKRHRFARQRSRKESERSMKESELEKSMKKSDKLIEEEKSETGKVRMSVFLAYARAVGILASFFIILFFSIYNGLTLFSNIWLSTWTSDPYLMNTTLKNTSKYLDKNNVYLGVYGGVGIGQAFFVLLYSLVSSLAMVTAAGALHEKMLGNILRSPMSFFDTTPIGRIVNRFSKDIETIDNNLPAIIRMWLNTVFQVLSAFIAISYSTPIFMVVILPLGILYYLIQKFYIPTSRQLKRVESTTRSPIYVHFSETITGASTIRAYNVVTRFIEENKMKIDKNLKFYYAGISSNRWLGVRLEFLGQMIILAAAMFAVLTPDISGGIVGLSISYALQVTAFLNWMVRMNSDLETNIVSVERVKEYSETPTEAEWKNQHHSPSPDWPEVGKVNFLNYETRYRSGLDLVLKSITAEIQGTEKVGIVGRTGAGKSSLTVALFRLIESASGSIIIDGETIANMGLHDLRSKLTILPQDPVIFSGTLRMNLDPFDDYTDDQLWNALENSHLKNFVSGLPEKLEHECGEGGSNLSVGQRQLLCLGRSLLRKTKILILDEATAAVDMETDDLIQKTIRTEFKDCTVLTIAHRLNTVLDYDKIMLLDQGKICEFDSPDNLLKDKSSQFYSMCKDANLVS